MLSKTVIIDQVQNIVELKLLIGERLECFCGNMDEFGVPLILLISGNRQNQYIIKHTSNEVLINHSKEPKSSMYVPDKIV